MTLFFRFAATMMDRTPIDRCVLLFLLLCMGTSLFAQDKSESPAEKARLGRLAVSQYMKLTKNGTPPSPENANAISGKFFSGQGTFDYFGNSVASAGDVNGDGYPDIVVGAYGYFNNSPNRGKAYIYYGGPAMDNTADVTMIGEAVLNYFAFAVSAAGDVNGDGFDDVIVGAYGNSTYAGRAYIYFGGSNLPTVLASANVVLNGEAVNNYFGYAVDAAGDVNGDGYADVVVGAYGNTSSTGRAYIYFGGANMNKVADVIMNGEAVSDQFGVSVSGAGDVNNDGYADVIVGAFQNSSAAGRAYVYLGGSAMNNGADVVLNGEVANNYFGVAVSSAGDVNGDGYADVIVGAYSYQSTVGRAYIFHGGAAMNNAADVTLTGEGLNNWFGTSVSDAGDVNGDGFDDVIVGAFGYSNSAGRAYLYFGGTEMNTGADKTLSGEGTNNFGYSVASAGDMNGDGYDDILVGAKGFNSSTGRTYLYQYSLTGSDVPDETMNGEAQENYFGTSVASAGDVNGDGYADVIVGAWGYNISIGRAYIFYGGPNMDNVADVTMTGEAATKYFGFSVASAGDVNGDGYADVIVGASGDSSLVGRAYIYYGGNPMNNTSDRTFIGEAVGNSFGYAVASAGDMNGDGYPDVIVGASGYFNNYGKVYIYYGGAFMNTVVDVSISGFTGEYFGTSVSTAGDVNGDGYADVIVGGFGASSYKGRAGIYFGASNLQSSLYNADVNLYGEAAANNFGMSVSTAGDVNGDGFSDVIVGANGYGATYVGRAYIYFGGGNMNGLADVFLTGDDGLNTYYGSSVSSAGDVNNDGYADVVVGGYNTNASGVFAKVFFGGAAMDYIPDIVLNVSATAYLGVAVAGAGDVNKDGYADIIFGEYGKNTATGRAYLYRSTAPSIVPRIASVADVPHDQGGIVNVRWFRSGYDVRKVSRVTGYRLERSTPAGAEGFAWTTVATIPASHNPQYSFPAPTSYDSMTVTGGSFFFRVTAATEHNDEYWRSNIVSGHSVDNLPPIAPNGAALAVQPNGNIRISWNQNRTDQDVGGYSIYRSTTSGFILSLANAITVTRDSSYLDITSAVGVQYFYRLTAVDIHGNESAPSLELSTMPLSVENLNELAPTEYTLDQNYPNPFNPVTQISFALPTAGFVTLRVFDAIGRNVETLVNEVRAAGRYTIPFSAGRLSSGLYVCEIRSEKFVQRIKMNLVK